MPKENINSLYSLQNESLMEKLIKPPNECNCKLSFG